MAKNVFLLADHRPRPSVRPVPANDPIEELRERLRNEPKPNEYRFLIAGGLSAALWITIFLTARWLFS